MRALKLVGLLGSALTVAFLATQLPVVNAQEAAKGPTYIGSTKCKTCHQGEAKGKIFETWTESAHSKAVTNLPADKQADAACLGCHSTGFKKGGFDPAVETTKAGLGAVGCEACHGPGSDYKDLKVMKDKAAAVAKGLIQPTEKVCGSCHSADMPKDCWKGAAEAPKFVFADAKKKIEHHLPKKAEAK